jgi:hypothetical protein
MKGIKTLHYVLIIAISILSILTVIMIIKVEAANRKVEMILNYNGSTQQTLVKVKPM